MNHLPVSLAPVTRIARSRLFRGMSMLTFVGVLSGSVFAQPDAPAPAAPSTPAASSTPTTPSAPSSDTGGANTDGNGRGRRGQNAGADNANGGGRGNFDPAQFQERMLANLREQFGVTDDAEWKIIADRITAVNDARRATAAFGFGGFGGRGGQGGQGGQNGGGRPGRTASPEQDALRQAITDKLPDAEIKSRLDRLREVRKANEEKLTKAQEELRAVLGVRQEAAAVMAGLLP